jgi:hypothetical protein
VKDVWTKKTSLPEPWAGPVCCTVNRRIYAIGGAAQGFDVGYPGVKKVMEYNPSKD